MREQNMKAIQDGEDIGVKSAMIDRLLVEGELVVDPSGKEVRVYPMSVEIANRLQVSPSWVSKVAKRNRCFQRRRELQVRVQAEAREELVRREGKRLAFNTERAIQLVDGVLDAYEESIKEHGVGRVTSMDVNTMIRLRRYLEGDADNRQEVMGNLTLEAIQSAHRDVLNEVQQLTPEMCGIEDDIVSFTRRKALAAATEDGDEEGELTVEN